MIVLIGKDFSEIDLWRWIGSGRFSGDFYRWDSELKNGQAFLFFFAKAFASE